MSSGEVFTNIRSDNTFVATETVRVHCTRQLLMGEPESREKMRISFAMEEMHFVGL